MRWVRRVILLLVLGFMTTVAVAWGIAAWLPQKNWDYTWLYGPGREGWNAKVTMGEYRVKGAVRRAWNIDHSVGVAWTIRHSPPPFADAIRVEGSFPVLMSPFVGIPWGNAESVFSSLTAAPLDGCEHAAGWPLLAGWYSINAPTANRTFTVQGGIELPSSQVGGAGGPEAWRIRALPLRPIWLGLAANTAIYAVCWFALITSAVQVRRTLRGRRGRCVRCAYDLSGLAAAACCPECGYRVASPRTSSDAQPS